MESGSPEPRTLTSQPPALTSPQAKGPSWFPLPEDLARPKWGAGPCWKSLHFTHGYPQHKCQELLGPRKPHQTSRA